ncbi:hypothetical protein BDZ94DRAFT_1234072 [Collybia nuda]|uniref:Uncharacterized protein n=1 Tax=Collybia nuda TaxID=64659 RepID=A0A9P6CMM2_9AGAR|nr:hypothetical protein BDZ94DRAFT_1234072 [Collybia nuda]
MLLTNFPIATSLILTLLSSVSCKPVHETNAQRMARGLPPSAPKFGRTLPGAKRTYTSAIPRIPYSGRLEVRQEDGSVAGYVRNSNSSGAISKFDHSSGLNFLGPEQELHVSFTAPFSGNGPFDIVASNPLFPAPFYVGASGTADINSIAGDSRNTISFSNVEQTPKNTIPIASATDGLNTFIESAIWSINPKTKELKAQYINPDKSKPETIIGYDIRANRLFFVGNITAYNVNNDTPASTVQLYLVAL